MYKPKANQTFRRAPLSLRKSKMHRKKKKKKRKPNIKTSVNNIKYSKAGRKGRITDTHRSGFSNLITLSSVRSDGAARVCARARATFVAFFFAVNGWSRVGRIREMYSGHKSIVGQL